MRIIFLSLLLSLTAAIHAEEAGGDPVPEKYQFTWTLGEADDTTLDLCANEDREFFRFTSRMTSLTISAKDAAAVGAVLVTADDAKKRLASEGAKPETQVVGTYIVEFRMDDQRGFQVLIRENRDVTLKMVFLSKGDALKFGRLLANGANLAAGLRRRLDRAMLATP